MELTLMPLLLSDSERLALLTPPEGSLSVVIDTDTYNEIDDQFAIVYALASPDRLQVEALYAAPFHNQRSRGPSDGMEQSYAEIVRLLDRLGRSPHNVVYKGATSWLPAPDQPVASAATEHLITLARVPRPHPLCVIALGAPTNIASALLQAPDIAGRIVVIWLGGHPQYWHTTNEFNLRQDLHASRVLLDSGVALVRVPCVNVTEHLTTTKAELEQFVAHANAVCDYLLQSFSAYYPNHFARSKEIWDVGAVAYLVNPHWCESALVASPILTDQLTWSIDLRRHLIREVVQVHRDAIFADLFTKIRQVGAFVGGRRQCLDCMGTTALQPSFSEMLTLASIPSTRRR
jgi:purine nucleosidase